ncbi:helix-turn-helix domain-containing protein [Streptantibioticus ferralitis]|uniref:Helix-turn-helix transcriptional regulator n=1 Tax=Streptantibioticus ferralitis TaxID=236510 RepID=A0ABT5Z7C3_9ACTN|nr:helix-turn-helix transcriptional regulator [Streptantibioticus ferralitis]MDF2258930.1 helix-turn-helix transcriptional regulator [Streptantibioticus ferralitis]
MPRSHGDDAPASYLAEGQWPDGRLRDDAPVSAVYAQAFTRQLRAVIGERGLNPFAIERTCGVSRRTIERTLKGRTLPDFGAIARLEAALKVDLWPRREHARNAEEQQQQTP